MSHPSRKSSTFNTIFFLLSVYIYFQGRNKWILLLLFSLSPYLVLRVGGIYTGFSILTITSRFLKNYDSLLKIFQIKYFHLWGGPYYDHLDIDLEDHLLGHFKDNSNFFLIETTIFDTVFEKRGKLYVHITYLTWRLEYLQGRMTVNLLFHTKPLLFRRFEKSGKIYVMSTLKCNI